jgi:hypothetical protein
MSRLSRFCEVLTCTGTNSAFEVEFLVPLSGASDSHTVSSDIDWTTFSYQISDTMSIPKKSLNLAYRFSTAPQKDRPRLLNSASHLKVLWEGARQELDARKKSKSRGKEKEFNVILVDLDEKTRGKKPTETKKVCI